MWTRPCRGVLAPIRVTSESRGVPAPHVGPRGLAGRSLISQQKAGPGAKRPEQAVAESTGEPSEGSEHTGSWVHMRGPGGEGGVGDRTGQRRRGQPGGWRMYVKPELRAAAGSRAEGPCVWGRVGKTRAAAWAQNHHRLTEDTARRLRPALGCAQGSGYEDTGHTRHGTTQNTHTRHAHRRLCGDRVHPPEAGPCGMRPPSRPRPCSPLAGPWRTLVQGPWSGFSRKPQVRSTRAHGLQEVPAARGRAHGSVWGRWTQTQKLSKWIFTPCRTSGPWDPLLRHPCWEPRLPSSSGSREDVLLPGTWCAVEGRRSDPDVPPGGRGTEAWWERDRTSWSCIA